MATGLQDFLKKKITVYVGSQDTEAGKNLLNDPLLTLSQGTNRVERAHSYVKALCQAQEELIISLFLSLAERYTMRKMARRVGA